MPRPRQTVWYDNHKILRRRPGIFDQPQPFDEKFRAGIRLFNSREFFKAHEVWEELWLGAAEPEKSFLQGLIQCAAAFHHYTRGNRNGARSLLENAYAKLEGFPETHRGVHLAALRSAMREFLDAPPDRPRCVPQPLPQIQCVAKP